MLAQSFPASARSASVRHAVIPPFSLRDRYDPFDLDGVRISLIHGTFREMQERQVTFSCSPYFRTWLVVGTENNLLRTKTGWCAC